MRILVDMDGVLADWETAFLGAWRERHPERNWVPIEERRSFYITEQYPADERHLLWAIYRAPGFYRTLRPVEGGLDAVRAMLAEGHDVRICTSPLSEYRNCVLEKYEWVEEHLGAAWIGRLVLTKDKTIVKGDVLIDDRPSVDGAAEPEWEHVLYDRPYNREVARKRRVTWHTWRSIFP